MSCISIVGFTWVYHIGEPWDCKSLQSSFVITNMEAMCIFTGQPPIRYYNTNGVNLQTAQLLVLLNQRYRADR